MPRPFPFALGIGTDICSVKRIYRILTKPEGRAQQFIRHFFNHTEIREHADRLSFAVELDTLKALGKQYPEARRKEVAGKTWRLAHFLGGR
jgi:phosphopantetheinyl transferase (holo-ACP synthase)